MARIFYGWIIVTLVWLIYFSNVGLILYGSPVINAAMMTAAGINEAVTGAAVAVCTACQGAFSPLAGIITRKKGVRVLFITGSALLAAGSALLGFFHPAGGFFIAAYGLFLGTGMTLAGILSAQSLLNNWFDKKKGLAFSIALSAGAMSGFLAPPLIEWIIRFGSWMTAWRFVSLMCGGSLLIAVFFIVNTPADKGLFRDGAAQSNESRKPRAVVSVKAIFTSKGFYLLLCGIVTRYVLYYAVIGHLIVFLLQRGFSSILAAAAISVLSISSLAGRFIAGYAEDKGLSSKFFLALANIFCAAGLLLLLLPINGLALICAAVCVMGTGNGIGYISQPLVISNEFGADIFPVINGYIYPANYILGALGPLIAGFGSAIGGSYIPVFAVFALLCLGGGMSLLAFSRYKRHGTI
jgi:cyanate permease